MTTVRGRYLVALFFAVGLVLLATYGGGAEEAVTREELRSVVPEAVAAAALAPRARFGSAIRFPPTVPGTESERYASPIHLDYLTPTCLADL